MRSICKRLHVSNCCFKDSYNFLIFLKALLSYNYVQLDTTFLLQSFEKYMQPCDCYHNQDNIAITVKVFSLCILFSPPPMDPDNQDILLSLKISFAFSGIS